jgi:alkylation response protein AidB-like acyl-CoA dehydrogenase
MALTLREVNPPGINELLDEAHALAPVVEAEAAAADAAAVLSREVGDRLRTSGLTGLWVPRCLGGSELPLPDAAVVLEELSRIDGSLGWVAAAHVVAHAAAGAFLGDGAVAEIFADGIPGIAGQGLPRGEAVAKDGGFVVGTTWSFGSGVHHARYVLATSFVCTPDGAPRMLASGARESRVCVIPREAVTFEGNWEVMGLRATGSVDYTGRDIFVPEEFSLHLNADRPLRGGPIYTLSTIGLACIVHTAWALGTARRIMDELAALVRTGEGRFAIDIESATFHERYAEAEGKLQVARGFVYNLLEGIQRDLDEGRELTTRQATLLRVMVQEATWGSADVVNWAYTAAGTTGLRAGTIQRCFRDMHAATQHGIVAPAIRATAGRELLGLAEGKAWEGRLLVDAHLTGSRATS